MVAYSVRCRSSQSGLHQIVFHCLNASEAVSGGVTYNTNPTVATFRIKGKHKQRAQSHTSNNPASLSQSFSNHRYEVCQTKVERDS